MAQARLVVGERSWNNYVYEACVERDVAYPDGHVPAVELYGQAGEDLMVLALLEARALLEAADLAQARYLEIGGNHPFALSPTYLLSRRLGMRGVIVEANPDLIDDLVRGRPGDVVVHGAVQIEDVRSVVLSVSRSSALSSLDRSFVQNWAGGTVGEASLVEVPALRVNDLVEEHLDGQAPVFLSVDVEGLDLQLLADFDFAKYRPWVVQAEPSDDHLPGNTDRMIDLMRANGYALLAKTWVNLLFVDADRA